MKFLTVIVFTLFLVGIAFPCTVSIQNIKSEAIYGRVIDEAQAAITGAKISIYKNAEAEAPAVAETIADENGRFEIKNFPAGIYIIRAKAENFASTTAFLKVTKSFLNAKNKEMVFTLVPSAACTGWVEMKKIKKSK
jgi:5-hydroxyisourate hydrolase-like protein (transthyretin family)